MDNEKELLKLVVDRVNVGVFIVDKAFKLTFWNNFMAAHSAKSAADVIGNNLFELFPELPERWFKKKIESVFLLKSYAFTSWEQRSHLFEFMHHRPITGGVEFMYQNLTLVPVCDDAGAAQQVMVIVRDSTDEAFYAAKLKEAMAELEYVSQIDGLTGIFNRRYWEKNLSIEHSRAKRYDAKYCLMIVDIDFFKKINDKYGHLAGDDAIRKTAQILQECTRDTDIVGRYGGEEFGIVLTETPISAAYVVAERIRERVMSMPLQANDGEYTMTVSIGLCAYHTEMESYEQLIKEADQALYESKDNGRNRVTVAERDRPFLTSNLARS